MAKIKEIAAREILDSRGNPTVEATVILHDNVTATAACPSGASVGTYEAVELRDRDERRFKGLGVLKAVDNIITVISPKLAGMEATNQQEIDSALISLDGTQNKGNLGANATLAVSMAVAKAAAKSSVLPLFLYLRQFVKRENLTLKIPTPLFNVINGGKHAGGNLDFQEFLVIPATSKSYQESLQISYNTYHALAELLKGLNLSTLIGDEGGFGPNLASNLDAIALIKQAYDKVNLRLGFDVFIGLDVAANSFFKDKNYYLKERVLPFSDHDLIEFYKNINKDYKLLYLEDPLGEEDWDGWQKLTTEIAGDTLVVGDDLTVTNPYRLQMAINKRAINGMIVKPNQIGTVLETMAVVEVARAAGLKIIVSHRSGETNDDFIADFAVAVSADYVKFGAAVRGERVAKYNRLLQIEKRLPALSK